MEPIKAALVLNSFDTNSIIPTYLKMFISFIKRFQQHNKAGAEFKKTQQIKARSE